MSRDGYLTVLLGVVVLSVFITPASRELFVGDETKYAQVIREMRAGAFFLPTLEGTPFTHKPPLHFWLIDVLTIPLGLYSMWAFVLPSIAGFLVLLALMWKMEGPAAAFVCGTALMVWGSAQTARMDVTFTAALVLAAWMLRKERLVAAGVATGIATLIKGPMAPVIIVMLFLFEWLRRRRAPSGSYGKAILLMVIIPLLWFVPAMIMGGSSYTHEVLVKQTAGRAVGAWVHRSPLWFYVAHAPADLFPWFLLAIVAILAAYRRADDGAKFHVSWILAVLIPYSALSSKLDVYMMAMIPPVALLVARLLRQADAWTGVANIANVIMIAILLIAGVAGLFIDRPDVAPFQPVIMTLLIASIVALIVALFARNAVASTVVLGLVPIAAFVSAALLAMPVVNELASDRPIVRVLAAQQVPPEEIALYSSPYLWTRDMPRELERVRYVTPESLRAHPAPVIVTARKHADEIADVLRGYHRTTEFQMIGKWFDVYRR
jgi:4-amino-4-deoxy-L-arabinose transferase-like glycosyltransferase